MSGYRATTGPTAAPATVLVKAPADELAAVAGVFAMALPSGEGTVGTAGLLLHRTGPDSLLLLGDGDAGALARRVAVCVDEERGMVEDLSDALAWFTVEGHEAVDVMAQGVALDLRVTQWPPGALRRTLVFGIEAYVQRQSPTGFRIGCAASHAAWLGGRLALACDPTMRPPPCR